jgi:tetratricopeptide (TPR) repeat protein
MTLRALTLTYFILLATLAPCGAAASQAQASQDRPARSQSLQTHDAASAAPSIPAQQSATPIAPDAAIVPPPPTLAEMRAMTAEQLDAEGDNLRKHKDFLSAMDCYREAVRKHPTAQSYNKIAITELMLKHPAQAANAARKALHKDKHLAEAWNNLGVTYYIRNKYEDAIDAYQRAISLTPGYASFHSNLAAAYMDAKRFDHAAVEYRKAFELDPGFSDNASQNGITAHMDSPQNRAQFFFVMARLCAGSGDLDRALHFLRAAMEDGYPHIDEVYRDKEFAGALADERFLALMKDRPVAVQ